LAAATLAELTSLSPARKDAGDDDDDDNDADDDVVAVGGAGERVRATGGRFAACSRSTDAR
jgi:hypothetical protein